jgi:hypothetical protein
MGKRTADDPRQLLFAGAYSATKGNGTESARRAGYNGGEKSLSAKAVRLLARARVQELLTAASGLTGAHGASPRLPRGC